MLIKTFLKNYHAICQKENLKILKSKNHTGHIYDQNAIKPKISIILKRRNLLKILNYIHYSEIQNTENNTH